VAVLTPPGGIAILNLVTEAHAIDRILADLNPRQREAVVHEGGPLFILAGAGSGKTRAITHRIAYLVEKGIPPDGVLAITFTNKAAEEMRERTERLCGLTSGWVSTFHSFAARILRRHMNRLDPYDNSFTIYDAEDSRALIREILADLDIDSKTWSARAVQERLSRLKNTTTGDIEDVFGSDLLHGQQLRSIWLAYVERMRERNAVDFDDLLLLTVRLLEEHPDVLERYQEQFRHVLIDEYQDTNAIQLRIGQLLSAAHRNICITGDPDQSIYRWRGADISNILDFEDTYPDAKVIVLDQNYRSTMNILHAANALIAHNSQRRPKSLWSARGDGEPVRVYRFADEGSEARDIASLVRAAMDDGVPCGDIAIFYRINSLSRAIEQELIYANVPYSIVGGIEFFLRKEVKDVLAYLRIIDNPRDTESLKRIINVPARGIGAQTIEKLTGRARASGERKGLLHTILQGAGEPGLGLGKKPAEAIEGFARLYRGLAAHREAPPAEILRAVILATGFEDHLRAAFGDEARERLENVGELVSAAEDYGRKRPDGDLTGFLELVNLLGDVDRWERSTDRVALMSLHSAKGLEFPMVIIAAIEDGIIPLTRGMNDEPDIEEERRLLYVGLTRARERLYLTHASNRLRFGRTRPAYPSRFLHEVQSQPPEGESLPRLEMDRETEESLSRAEREDLDGRFEIEDRAAGWPEEYPDTDEEPHPVGTRVRHDTYGDGEVIRVSGIRERARLTVRFDDGEEKQFVLGYAPLRRIR
jgi:DNA helicase-2/ATP-dependent DNA helicase PcrA